MRLKIVDLAIYLCPLCNLKPYKITSLHFIQIFTKIILCAECKNCNYGLPIFEVWPFETEKLLILSFDAVCSLVNLLV